MTEGFFQSIGSAIGKLITPPTNYVSSVTAPSTSTHGGTYTNPVTGAGYSVAPGGNIPPGTSPAGITPFTPFSSGGGGGSAPAPSPAPTPAVPSGSTGNVNVDLVEGKAPTPQQAPPQPQPQGFSGAVEESMAGQVQGTNYFVGGQKVGGIRYEGGKPYADVGTSASLGFGGRGGMGYTVLTKGEGIENLPEGEKPIISNGRIVGIESSFLGKSMSVENYNKEIQRINEVTPQVKYFDPKTGKLFEQEQFAGKGYLSLTPLQVYVDPKTGKPISNINAYMEQNRIPFGRQQVQIGENLKMPKPIYDIRNIPERFQKPIEQRGEYFYSGQKEMAVTPEDVFNLVSLGRGAIAIKGIDALKFGVGNIIAPVLSYGAEQIPAKTPMGQLVKGASEGYLLTRAPSSLQKAFLSQFLTGTIAHPLETAKGIASSPYESIGMFFGAPMINKVMNKISNIKEMKSFGKDFVFEKPAEITHTPLSKTFPTEIKLEISDTAIKDYVAKKMAENGIDYNKVSGIDKNFIEGSVKLRIINEPEKFIPKARRLALENQGIRKQQELRDYALKRIEGQFNNLNNIKLMQLSEKVKQTKNIPELSNIQKVALQRFSEALEKERIRRAITLNIEREKQVNLGLSKSQIRLIKERVIQRAKYDPSSFLTGARQQALQQALKSSEKERILEATKKALERTPEKVSKDISDLLINKKQLSQRILHEAKYQPEKFIPGARQQALQLLKPIVKEKPIVIVGKLIIREPERIHKMVLERMKPKTRNIPKARTITSMLIKTEEVISEKQISKQILRTKQLIKQRNLYPLITQKQTVRLAQPEQLRQISKQKQKDRFSFLSLTIPRQKFMQGQKEFQVQPPKSAFLNLIIPKQILKQPLKYSQRQRFKQSFVNLPIRKRFEENINRRLTSEPKRKLIPHKKLKRKRIKRFTTLPTVFEELTFGGARSRQAKIQITGMEAFRF